MPGISVDHGLIKGALFFYHSDWSAAEESINLQGAWSGCDRPPNLGGGEPTCHSDRACPGKQVQSTGKAQNLPRQALD